MDDPSSKEDSTEIVVQNDGAMEVPIFHNLRNLKFYLFQSKNALLEAKVEMLEDKLEKQEEELQKVKEENKSLGEKLRESEEKAQMVKNEVKNIVIKCTGTLLGIFSWKKSSSSRRIHKRRRNWLM
jgi:hypothetical protein